MTRSHFSDRPLFVAAVVEQSLGSPEEKREEGRAGYFTEVWGG
jgi:hypothetical protein